MFPSLRARTARGGTVAVLLASALAVPVSGCTPSPGEAAAEAALAAAGAEAVQIDDDGDTISYRTDAGQVTVTGGEAAVLPDDFPGDVYLPGDYVVQSTLAMNQDLFVGLAVPEEVPVLYAAARQAMADQGWTETMAALQNSENGLLTFEKGDRSAVLSLSREAEGTSFGLQLTRIAR